jgi:hypothetical protein
MRHDADRSGQQPGSARRPGRRAGGRATVWTGVVHARRPAGFCFREGLFIGVPGAPTQLIGESQITTRPRQDRGASPKSSADKR